LEVKHQPQPDVVAQEVQLDWLEQQLGSDVAHATDLAKQLLVVKHQLQF